MFWDVERSGSFRLWGATFLLGDCYMSMKNIVVGIGEALWDMLPEGRQIGGAPANFAYHVSQFGLEGIAVSAIGDDRLGRELVRAFERHGVNSHLDIVPYPTGTVQVELDAAGVPKYEITECVAWDNIPFTDELAELARHAKAVCFGSLAQRNEVSRQTIHHFLDAIPAENNALIVFDINLRQHFYTKEVIEDSMRRCNILKINDEELEVIRGMFDFGALDVQAACRRVMRAYALEILILTCGAAGSYVFTRGEVSYLSTPKVPVADTVGAGDSFTAAFIAEMLQGKSVAEAHRKAVATAAYVCTQHGAMPM